MQPVHPLVIARERGREIETEPVHVHVQHPVTQTVHHQLQRVRMQQVKGVAGAGEIQIEARVIGIHPVVCEIVDPAEAQRRAKVISFGCMVVNHVENRFDSRSMQTAHHRLELDDLFAHLSAAGVLSVWCKKSDRIVTPVIR